MIPQHQPRNALRKDYAKRGDHLRPSRHACEDVIRRVAFKHGISEAELIHSAKRSVPLIRFEAWHLIIQETGCSQNGLADVWGIDNSSIIKGLRRHRSLQPCAQKALAVC